jgi:FkbM family methyltransferase
LKHWIAAGVEHEAALATLHCDWIVDIGANVGQFALVARQTFPEADIWSFEPQPNPANEFARLFSNDPKTKLVVAAIGPVDGEAVMHVSAQNDSSSLLPISKFQSDVFPGTGEVGTATVYIAPLEKFLEGHEIGVNGLLKIDVQGYELEVLKGSVSHLRNFSWIYIEASFVELYKGQALVHEVIEFLRNRGFLLVGLFQPHIDSARRTIQGDFLFRRMFADVEDKNPTKSDSHKNY